MKKRRRQKAPLKLNRSKKVVRKDEPLDREFLSALQETLSEWTSQNDDKSYASL
jgi:hypothetical protein